MLAGSLVYYGFFWAPLYLFLRSSETVWGFVQGGFILVQGVVTLLMLIALQ